MAHSTIVEATIIPWELSEDSWGVIIKHASGRQKAYMVGTLAEAEEEIKDLLRPTKIMLAKS